MSRKMLRRLLVLLAVPIMEWAIVGVYKKWRLKRMAKKNDEKNDEANHEPKPT